MTDEAEENPLIERVRAGDEQAAHELSTAYRPRLLRFALSRGLPPPDGEEVVQDTLLAVIVQLKDARFRNESNLSTWILGIFRNKVADWHRSRGRSSLAFQSIHDLVDTPPLASGWRQQNLETVMAIRDALAKLPEMQRVILLLYETERSTIQEIASLLRTNESRVYRTLVEAREGLREILSSTPYGTARRLKIPQPGK